MGGEPATFAFALQRDMDSLKVRTKDRTRNRWRYVFADVVCQAELAWCFVLKLKMNVYYREVVWYVER